MKTGDEEKILWVTLGLVELTSDSIVSYFLRKIQNKKHPNLALETRTQLVTVDKIRIESETIKS